jgi:hypothetical protein
MPKHPVCFSLGNQVRRKNFDLPIMTIEEVYAPFYFFPFKCVWVEEGQLRWQLFRADELELVSIPRR